MYAIVKISDEQIKVAPKTRCFTPKLPEKEGSEVTFDEVLLVEDGKEVAIGTSVLKEWKVVAEVVKHIKGDKVTVFKKKRRQGYRVKRGHRQEHTQILIKKITKN
ncbi:MAG: 50S ribosomal protein L21 [Bacteroidota bacterium]